MKNPTQHWLEQQIGHQEMEKKRGPKPKHGKGKPCKRRSLSIPDDLFEWCQSRANLRGSSLSAYIVMVLEQRRTWLKTGRYK